MAPRKCSSSSSPISIGNCKVEIDGDDYSCQAISKGVLISLHSGASIKISTVDESRKARNLGMTDTGGKCYPLEDSSFVLLNPNDGVNATKSLLQEVLKIYSEQLPAMNYAANTGKESHFLEKCISSGKYRTLIVKSNSSEGLEKVIAAVSYQIIPSDTQYAEVPLAAVSSNYQKKLIGHLLYNELKERLRSVGISEILCWADKVSEGFWFKQGFISIGEVNSKGKARRLPIKADVRRALCFPGGSTLMVAHLNKNTVASVNSSEHDKLGHVWDMPLCLSVKSSAKSSNRVACKTPGQVEIRGSDSAASLNKHQPYPVFHQIESTQPQHFAKNNCSTDSLKVNVATCTNGTCTGTGTDPELEVTENGSKANGNNNSSGKRVKRRVWEASLSSLKSKRIKGSHCMDDCQDDQDLNTNCETNASFKTCSLETSKLITPAEIIPSNPTDHSHLRTHADGRLSCLDSDLKGNCPRVMFMNIADDAKKACLTKIVEELGGSVTANGSSSTHVITGKARRTLNFCVALCSGAWIVSPHWLKSSFRDGKFLDESPFILEDEDYLQKYKLELKEPVLRAKSNPNWLLKGYNVCVAKHIQPSVDVLSAIIKAAGGNVIRRLGCIKEPSKSIFLACEEDMEDAMVAAKKGIWTFSSEWFMSCVMKQDLDMGAPQFAESL